MAEVKILSDGEQPAIPPVPPSVVDGDPAETREWLESSQCAQILPEGAVLGKGLLEVPERCIRV